MAQNVGTPRFYVDHLLWLKSLGEDYWTGNYSGISGDSSQFVGLTPADYHFVADAGYTFSVYMEFYSAPYIQTTDQKWKAYTAILGHNIQSAGSRLRFTVNTYPNIPNKFINWGSNYGSTPHNGFTLCCDFDSYSNDDRMTYEFSTVDPAGFSEDLNIGCISHGNYYDMPHSPDLNITMTRELDGVKRFRTKGGSDLINYKYLKAPNWGENPPWELQSQVAITRVGRRIWDLNYSFLQDSDIFPDVNSLTNYETSGYSDGDDITANTILEDDSLFGRVIHKTRGGQLPFIFQPDNNNFNPDGFAICKFDMNSFSFKQTSNTIYSCQLKIKEIW